MVKGLVLPDPIDDIKDEENDMNGSEAYEIWLTSYYGSVQDAYNKGVKTWENLVDKTREAWEIVARYKTEGLKGLVK